MKPEGEFSREELGRALGLGEVLVVGALVVLAPVVRGETAYGSVNSFLPRVLAGDGYFLIVLAFLGAVLLARVLASGRLTVPEPGALGLLAACFGYVALRGAFSDHPYEAQRETLAWLSNLLVFALVILVADLGRIRRLLVAAVAASLAVQGFQALYQYYVTLPEIREFVERGVAQGGVDPQNPAAVSRLLSGEPFTTFLHANALGGWMASAALASSGLLAGYMLIRGQAPERTRLPVSLPALVLAVVAFASFCFCLSFPAFGATVIAPQVHALFLTAAGLSLGLCLFTGWRARALSRPLVALCWLPLAVLFAWTFRLTGSKGAYIALGTALAGALFAAPPAEGRTRKILRAAGGAALGLMLAGALAYLLIPGLPGRSEMAGSVGVRLGYWRPAAVMAWENPAFGLGPGTFGAHYPRLKLPMAEESQSAHSAYMETAAEQGFLGLALLLAFWGWVMWRIYRRVASPAGDVEPDARAARLKWLGAVLLAGTGATAAAAKLTLTGVSWQALATLGLVWAGCFALVAWPLALSGDDGPKRAARLVDWALFAALGAFLVHSAGSMGMSLRSLVGPALILAALALAGPGRRELVLSGRRVWIGALAVAAATVAAGLLGAREWRRGVAFQAIEAASQSQDPKLTRREHKLLLAVSVSGAIEADPQNWHLRLHAGRAAMDVAIRAANEQERLAFFRAAEECYRDAIRLAPARTSARRALARFYVFWRKKLPLAPEEYEKLHKLYPLKAEYIIEWADAELLAGRRDRALRLYRRALETSRLVGDEPIHLSIQFENPNRLRWQLFVLKTLAARLDDVLKDDPKNAPVLYRRAVAAVARKRFPEALEFMKRAAAAEPDDAQLLLFEGYTHRLAGDWKRALDAFERAGKLEKGPGRAAGPGAVRRARYRTGLARKLEKKRKHFGKKGAAR